MLTICRACELFKHDTFICRYDFQSSRFSSPLGGSDAEESEVRNSCLLPCALHPVPVPESGINDGFRNCCFFFFTVIVTFTVLLVREILDSGLLLLVQGVENSNVDAETI